MPTAHDHNATPRRYYTPITHRTGAAHNQLNTHQKQIDWFFDAHDEYQHTGFLDAPLTIPTGSVRALDCPSLVLGISGNVRGGTL